MSRTENKTHALLHDKMRTLKKGEAAFGTGNWKTLRDHSTPNALAKAKVHDYQASARRKRSGSEGERNQNKK